MVDYQFVTERLAVGSAIETPENMKELARDGITHVVNMQMEFDDGLISDGTGVQVLWNACEDDFLPKPAELFWKGVRFTLEALRQPEARVLFHCAMGIHRSPLMLLAVLRVQGYDLWPAIHMIQKARHQAAFPSIYIDSVEDFVLEYQASAEMD